MTPQHAHLKKMLVGHQPDLMVCMNRVHKRHKMSAIAHAANTASVNDQGPIIADTTRWAMMQSTVC
ncbi:hypothetical protein A0E43_09110 [Pectobacterium cacticida]